MAIRPNHTIAAARDKEASARLLTEILDLPTPPTLLGPFAIVHVSDDTSLDFIDDDGAIAPQHYAFLVDESEFDAIFARMRERGLAYWADPFKRTSGRINEWDAPAATCSRRSHGRTGAAGRRRRSPIRC